MPEQGATGVYLLNDEFRVHSSLDSVEDADHVFFFARVLHLDEGDLPREVLERCEKLHKSVESHVNVATFLGLVVEEHVKPQALSVARIFEEYAEGEQILV